MKRLFTRVAAAMLLACVSAGMFCACGDDDEIEGGSVSEATAMLVGTWFCTSQQWDEEDCETEVSNYEPSYEYAICFEADGSGYMRSGSEELFEVGTHGGKQYFEWYVYKKGDHNWVHADVYSGKDYRIDKINANTLVMTWRDEDYVIKCQFVRMTEED